MTRDDLKPIRFPRDTVYKKLKKYCSLGVYMLDDFYDCVTVPEWDRIIEAIGAPHHGYMNEDYDCDKFARIFQATVFDKFEINGIFFVADLGCEHAYNLILPHDGNKLLTPKVFEPQTRDFRPKGGTHYKLKHGFLC